MAEMERFELSRRSYRPTGVRSQTLQPLGYISLFYFRAFTHKKVGGETGIRTPEAVITAYMISNHAPSAISDISPNNIRYFIILFLLSQSFLKFSAFIFVNPPCLRLYLRLHFAAAMPPLSSRLRLELVKSFAFYVCNRTFRAFPVS